MLSKLSIPASICALLLTLAAGPAAQGDKVDLVQDLHWKDHHFAMSNWFYNYKFDQPKLHIKLLKERGYGGI
ncbi:MAG: hypothetical protein VCA40_03355, partial [Roseibacillus sp.]